MTARAPRHSRLQKCQLFGIRASALQEEERKQELAHTLLAAFVTVHTGVGLMHKKTHTDRLNSSVVGVVGVGAPLLRRTDAATHTHGV